MDEIMSTEVRWRFDDQPLDEVVTQMADSQIRRRRSSRMMIMHKPVGIVALGELATKTLEGGQKQEVHKRRLRALFDGDVGVMRLR